MAFVAVYPVLAAGPVRWQHHERWALQTLGPGGPVRFTDRDGNGVLGLGDWVYVSRGHFSMINFQITGPASIDMVDPTRPAVSHIDGVEKRFAVVAVDPVTGALTLDNRAQRILHAWNDYLGLLGLAINFVFFRQNIAITGQINQGVFFLVHPISPVVLVFPGSGMNPVIIPRPCDPSPNQDDPCGGSIYPNPP